MSLIDPTIIIADDLTGANDTALQFFKNGCSAKIIIDYDQDFSALSNVDVFASSTESRNVDSKTALDRASRVVNKLKEKLNAENFYKKIDSTMRGHIGVEVLALLEAAEKDAVVLTPSYIEESRSAIGGYALLNGIPIERTQCALDPKAPIYDSYIPDILKKELKQGAGDLIGTIELKTITKGAGPISLKISELIQKGKKIIVADAMNKTDLEQIALAIFKSDYDIIPCGSAGLADAINKTCSNDEVNKKIESIDFLPRLIVSGTATTLGHKQIDKLKEEKKGIFYVDLTIENIVNGLDNETLEEIIEKLQQGKDVTIHSSNINNELLDDESLNILIDAGIARDEFSDKITDFLSDLVYKINLKSNFILIMVGGETSYKCAYRIESKYLEIQDAIMPAIPLCKDANGKIIVTKSGNFGSLNTLVDIINYFDRLRP